MATVTPRSAPAPRLRPGAGARRGRLPESDALERRARRGSVDALLLTAKARVIAPVLVWRRGDDDVLLLTEPELGDALRAQLTRMRFAAKCEIEPEEHVSTIVLGGGEGIPNRDYGVPAVEVLDSDADGDADLERLRIEAATPRYGRELDDRVLPAEAGLEERAISFTKGCYPGQEPIARQHYRGKVNRRLRVLEVDGTPAPETPVVLRREGGRPRHERGRRAGARATCAWRCRTTPS